jgi:hypothetical protein
VEALGRVGVGEGDLLHVCPDAYCNDGILVGCEVNNKALRENCGSNMCSMWTTI